MYELDPNEVNRLVSQSVIPSKSHLGGSSPYAFTETGVAMLSSVLRSEQTVRINIAIMRTFVLLRKMLYKNQNLFLWRSQIDLKLDDNDKKFLVIFEYLRKFEREKQKELIQKNRPQIGFKS